MKASLCFLEKKIKTILLILFVVSLVMAFPTMYVYNRTTLVLTEETQSKAKDIAISIASFITHDIERYRTLAETEILVEGSEEYIYYEQMLGVMRSIKMQADADFIFTAKMIDGETSAYVLDGEDPQSDLFSPFGSTDIMNPTELMAYELKQPVASDVEVDPNWGTFLTGYAPIIDYRDNEMIGLVGVDFSADFLQQRFTRIAWVIFLGFALFAIFLSLLLYITIHTIHTRASIDELTGLGSKRCFKKRFAELLKEAERTNHSFVLLMLDVDAFKAINDEHGHLLGDHVLYQIARAIEQALITKHCCFRYGGDEFAILLPDTTLAQAEKSKLRIASSVAALVVEELDSTLSISIGMAQGGRGCSLEAMIREADVDLYEQKRANAESKLFTKKKP